jgi:SAM-dependent methyltransferase
LRRKFVVTANTISQPDATGFIERWASSGAAERANYQIFLTELCDVLNVPRPEPTKINEDENAYVFEKAVIFHHGDGTNSTGRIDLYKRGCFVLEAKQGSNQNNQAQPELIPRIRRTRRGTAVRGTQSWDQAMMAARGQAEQYARALPAGEGRPPFLIIVDVGHSIALYAEFSRTGGAYVPFPDSTRFRIPLREIEKEEVRELLRAVWTDPLALDPTRRSARITREIAEQLARLAKSLEASGHKPERVAAFLMRSIFTMFAEDVRLVPKNSFTELLESIRGQVKIFPDMVESLWRAMAEGSFSPTLRQKLLRFNGGLFESAEALPITEDELELLIEASRADWHDVEPAIFGTMLEQALDPVERHKLGAHYTPRAYVERLVLPTVIEPLRDEWAAAQAAAVTLAKAGRLDEAVAEVKRFHHHLCNVRVLDPACGTGNFLYVTLEHMKRLEGEVLTALEDFGEQQRELIEVDPHQLLGLEVNPRAAAIADLVLWIGHLQWHFRTRGDALPQEPVLKKFHNIENRDAVLAYDAVEIVKDEGGAPLTRWDGRTMKKHPVTGEDVPDERARVSVMSYTNARKAAWQAADFIVGNPPFIGNSRMRDALGDGYVEALRRMYESVPESSDYVMYWWERAAQLVREGKVRRFGLITTNSLRQTFNRRVIENHLTAENPLSLIFAVPDHPWVDTSNGAAVRISMTIGEAGEREGTLSNVVSEARGDAEGLSVELVERKGKIYADLTIGANVTTAETLKANGKLATRGVALHGAGFIITPDEAKQLGLGKVLGLEKYIRHYRNGKDLTGKPRGMMVIDLEGLTAEDVRDRYPEIYQRVLERVKPERDQNNERSRRELWWLFGRRHTELRSSLKGLSRYIATVETSKHRFFVFLDENILPDNKLVNIALDDAFNLGVLSSRIHVTWALAAGSRLGVGNDPVYVKTTCFDTFPFPDCSEGQMQRIRELAETLDAHRKRQQAQHPRLTITEMYNVLARLSAGEALNERERVIHEQGLVSVLKALHDDLDQAVCDAYGWQPDISDEEILQRLVALNHERAEEERRGLVRWLRPAYQHPQAAMQTSLDIKDEAATKADVGSKAKMPFPSNLAEQASAVRHALAAYSGVVTPAQLAKSFQRARVDRIEELLQTLVLLGQARQVEEGKYAA